MTHFAKKLLTSTAVTLLALLLASTVLAETDSLRRSDQLGSRYNAGYVSKYALNETVRQLAYQSKTFQWQLERELNRSYLDGTSRERSANQLSVDFRHAAETLHSLYAVGRNVDNSTEDAESLLRLGSELDDFVLQTHLSRATLESWNAMQCELTVLAGVYDTSAKDESQGDTGVASGGELNRAASSHTKIWLWPSLNK